MKIKIFIILAAFCASVHAQDLFYKTYEWDQFKTGQENNSGDGKVILLKKEVIEFAYDEGSLIEYDLWHEAELISSDEEVERNNKKYIPYTDDADVIIARARVIKPDKSEILLDESKILTSFDEQSNRYYKYFAFEGLQKGCIIDHYYVIKKQPEFYGICSYIQSDYLTGKYEFDLFSPENLIFKFNLMNTDGELIRDTVITGKNHWLVNLDSVPALKEEEGCPYNSLLVQLVYKLDENRANNTRDISSYGRASQNVYANIYNNMDHNDEKALLKFLKSIDLDGINSDDERIKRIEHYIKKNINFIPVSSPELEKIDRIIPDKNASAFGLVKLYSNIFKTLEIEHQIVITSDRNRVLFDPSFESFHNLSTYLIYFPESQKFLIPGEFAFRYGFIPCEYTDNYGLFIKGVKIGDFETGVGEVKYVPADSYPNNHHNHTISVVINDDFSRADIDLIQSSKGYFAVYIQPYIEVMREEDVKEMTERLLKDLISQTNIVSWNYENATAESAPDKPLLLKAKLTSENLIETAGNRYVFKVGELIGPQVEIYSEKERLLPLHDTYKREFVRKITIEIPKGYKVMNLDEMNMYADYVKNGEKKLLFESTAVLNGNKIEISINEYYDELNFKADEYEDYKKVVNSAADFNKKALIFAEE